jgi:carbonic anhydrase
MPYKLRKAPNRDLYWVVTKGTTKKHSKLPLEREKALMQMKALYAAASRELKGGVLAAVPYGSGIIQVEDDGRLIQTFKNAACAEILVRLIEISRIVRAAPIPGVQPTISLRFNYPYDIQPLLAEADNIEIMRINTGSNVDAILQRLEGPQQAVVLGVENRQPRGVFHAVMLLKTGHQRYEIFDPAGVTLDLLMNNDPIYIGPWLDLVTRLQNASNFCLDVNPINYQNSLLGSRQFTDECFATCLFRLRNFRAKRSTLIDFVTEYKAAIQNRGFSDAVIREENNTINILIRVGRLAPAGPAAGPAVPPPPPPPPGPRPIPYNRFNSVRPAGSGKIKLSSNKMRGGAQEDDEKYKLILKLINQAIQLVFKANRTKLTKEIYEQHDALITNLKYEIEMFLERPGASEEQKESVREFLHDVIPKQLRLATTPEFSKEALGYGQMRGGALGPWTGLVKTLALMVRMSAADRNAIIRQIDAVTAERLPDAERFERKRAIILQSFPNLDARLRTALTRITTTNQVELLDDRILRMMRGERIEGLNPIHQAQGNIYDGLVNLPVAETAVDMAATCAPGVAGCFGMGKKLHGGITSYEFNEIADKYYNKKFMSTDEMQKQWNELRTLFSDGQIKLIEEKLKSPGLIDKTTKLVKEVVDAEEDYKISKTYGVFGNAENLIKWSKHSRDSIKAITDVLVDDLDKWDAKKMTFAPMQPRKRSGMGKKKEYAEGKAKVFVLTCIDPRYNYDVTHYLEKDKKLHKNYDLFVLAGASVGATKKEWTKTFFENLELGIKLHGIKEVWCFDHLDCGMYKATFKLKKDDDPAIHISCMDKLKKQIKKKHPSLEFRKFLVTEHGKVDKIGGNKLKKMAADLTVPSDSGKNMEMRLIHRKTNPAEAAAYEAREAAKEQESMPPPPPKRKGIHKRILFEGSGKRGGISAKFIKELREEYFNNQDVAQMPNARFLEYKNRFVAALNRADYERINTKKDNLMDVLQRTFAVPGGATQEEINAVLRPGILAMAQTNREKLMSELYSRVHLDLPEYNMSQNPILINQDLMKPPALPSGKREFPGKTALSKKSGSGKGKWSHLIRQMGKYSKMTPSQIDAVLARNDAIKSLSEKTRFQKKKENVIASFPKLADSLNFQFSLKSEAEVFGFANRLYDLMRERQGSGQVIGKVSRFIQRRNRPIQVREADVVKKAKQEANFRKEYPLGIEADEKWQQALAHKASLRADQQKLRAQLFARQPRKTGRGRRGGADGDEEYNIFKDIYNVFMTKYPVARDVSRGIGAFLVAPIVASEYFASMPSLDPTMRTLMASLAGTMFGLAIPGMTAILTWIHHILVTREEPERAAQLPPLPPLPQPEEVRQAIGDPEIARIANEIIARVRRDAEELAAAPAA